MNKKQIRLEHNIKYQKNGTGRIVAKVLELHEGMPVDVYEISMMVNNKDVFARYLIYYQIIINQNEKIRYQFLSQTTIFTSTQTLYFCINCSCQASLNCSNRQVFAFITPLFTSFLIRLCYDIPANKSGNVSFSKSFSTISLTIQKSFCHLFIIL